MMFKIFSAPLRVLAVYVLLVAPGLLSGLALRDAGFLAALPFIMLLLPAALACLGARSASLGWHLFTLWSATWALGYAIIILLFLRYGVGPLDVPVVQAIINTTRQEALEFASDMGFVLIGSCAVCCLALARGVTLVMRRWILTHVPKPKNRYAAGGLALLKLCLIFLLHGNSTIERADPLTLGKLVFAEAASVIDQTKAMRAARRNAPARLASWKPTYTGSGRRTLVLVIGESSNRWDWSLYGYSRNTNPELAKLRSELLIFKDVVSSYGSTSVELKRMFTVADAKSENGWNDEPTVFNLAQSAGYKTFWLTNQSFPFAAALFGEEADKYVSVYQGRIGRHDASLDEKLLPQLDAALADPAPLKLIVLHTLGSHPEYERRYPPAFAKFGVEQDAVDGSMQDRWIWVRWKRAQYDNSILYTDHLLAQAIDRLQHDAETDLSLLFLSDHAQDVGHLTSSWGHQFHLESGFTVPFLLWQKGVQPRHELESRPYQTDHLEQTLLHLMAIDTARSEPQFDLLGDAFKPWQRMIDGRPYVPGVSHRPEGNPPISGR